MNENDPPLKMHPDFIGTLGKLAKPEAPVLMRITKGLSHLGDRLRRFFTKVGRQFGRCFSDSFRK